MDRDRRIRRKENEISRLQAKIDQFVNYDVLPLRRLLAKKKAELTELKNE